MARPKVISLFSGAGGLDYGFEAAGFGPPVAVELDHDCCETLRHSRPRWRLIERDIFQVSTEELLDGVSAARGEADIVIGGPPCQPFSKSGYWSSGDAKRLADPRSDTLCAFLRVVREALPRAFLLENVHGLAFSGKDEGLQLLLAELASINRATKSNYRPRVHILNAAWYGVPQLRERVFVIASRDGARFDFPRPSHADLEESGSRLDLADRGTLAPYRNAWDAIGDVHPDKDEDLALRGKWADLLPSIPEGQNYLWHTERGGGRRLFGWRRRYWSFLLKLAKARPSWTLQAQPGPAIGPFHWSNRRLSMREMCRIQTFPDDVRVLGSLGSVQRQIGNAVPSLLAEVLAREIRKQLFGTRLTTPAPKLLPSVKRPVPPPEPVRAIPERFDALEGEHSAHPGTGRGFGALRRRSVA